MINLVDSLGRGVKCLVNGLKKGIAITKAIKKVGAQDWDSDNPEPQHKQMAGNLS